MTRSTMVCYWSASIREWSERRARSSQFLFLPLHPTSRPLPPTLRADGWSGCGAIAARSASPLPSLLTKDAHRCVPARSPPHQFPGKGRSIPYYLVRRWVHTLDERRDCIRCRCGPRGSHPGARPCRRGCPQAPLFPPGFLRRPGSPRRRPPSGVPEGHGRRGHLPPTR